MEKKLYLATVIAVIAAIGLILSCGLSYFSDTEEVTYNTFTAGVSDSCTWKHAYTHPQLVECIGDCNCNINKHMTTGWRCQCIGQCWNECHQQPYPRCYMNCLANCADEHTDDMMSCELINNRIWCTCYCPWGCEP